MHPASSSNSRGANHFYPVQNPQSLNFPVAMNQMNNMNNGQAMPQNFPFNSVGPSNFLNHAQYLGFPNQIPHANQLFQLQMFHLNPQVVPGNLNTPQNVGFTANCQPSNLNIPPNVPFHGSFQPLNLSLQQSVGFHMNPQPANIKLPQNVPFAGNSQLGLIDPRGIAQNMGSLIASNGTPVTTPQSIGSNNSGQGIVPAPPSQNQTNFQARPSKFQGSQRNAIWNNTKNNGKPAHNKNYKPISKQDASGNRTMKPRFQNMQNSKGNFGSPNVQTRRGNGNVRARTSSVVNSAMPDQVEEKRMVTLNYTDKEIQQWREERRKHYPSKANIEKKLMEKMTQPEVFDKVAELRRQQLKEVLAKQAELGCEVAEIPSYYLSNLEQPAHEKKNGGKAFSKKEKFQNRWKKRGRDDKNHAFSNKQEFANHHSVDGNRQDDSGPNRKRPMNDSGISQHPARKPEPTLLQKLLSADIKRDQHYLLQACRFMVLNSFFTDWPEKELKFPQVVIKESETQNDLDLEESCSGKKSIAPVGKNENADYNNNSSLVQDEEGEIID